MVGWVVDQRATVNKVGEALAGRVALAMVMLFIFAGCEPSWKARDVTKYSPAAETTVAR